MNAWKHLRNINRHRRLVRVACFKIGLYKQGLLHDLSKYSPAEFFVGVKYFQGTQSPNNAERADIGYSSAWLHHKGRNKHHSEYWIDYSMHNAAGKTVPVEMPLRYAAEMLMDRIAACKVYNPADYRDDAALKYYQSGKDPAPMHDNTRRLLEEWLQMLAKEGERATYKHIRELLRGKK
jgi:hypothetical protein